MCRPKKHDLSKDEIIEKYLQYLNTPASEKKQWLKENNFSQPTLWRLYKSIQDEVKITNRYGVV